MSVEVPATSANLGPGFDCFGLALQWRDTVDVEVTAGPVVIEVSGEGAATVPRDERHLIVVALRRGLAELGTRIPGLRLRAGNTIPHGRGLGSSSAAIVAGLVAARALAGMAPDPHWILEHAAAIEGHPDNVAAASLGGFVMSYRDRGAVGAVRSLVHPSIGAVALIPAEPVPTPQARALLPSTVPHPDAAADAGRAALLVHALAHDPALLPVATEDWLHQRYRRGAMPASADLVDQLRARGLAAVISGAGPTVLVLGDDAALERVAEVAAPGFRRRRLDVGSGASVRPR